MSEITNRTYVIMTRNTGKFLVTREQADAVVNMINSNNPKRAIQIGPDISFATADFVHAVPAWKSEEIEREKSGQWKCAQNNWHAKFDTCKCKWGMDTSSTKSLIADKPMSDEEKARADIIKQLVDKGYRLAHLVRLKGKSVQELKVFLENYKC